MTDATPSAKPKPKRGRKPKSTTPPLPIEAANPLDSLVDDSAAPTPELNKLTRFDRVNVIQINRSQLKNASYNPRTITPRAVIDLRESLQNHGLVEPLIYNIRTGNLVGGHQRLSQLDILEGKPDYSIHVNQIDIDERQERALNIMLNNPNAQGEYDAPVLIDMFRQDTFDLDLSGFKPIDLELLAFDAGLDTDLINSLFTPAAIAEISQSTAAIDGILNQSDELKKQKLDQQQRAANNGHSSASQAESPATRRQSQDEDDNSVGRTSGDSESSGVRYPAAASPAGSDSSHTHTANGESLTPEHFRAAKRAGEEKLKPQRESAYYLTLSFQSDADKWFFCDAYGIPRSAAHADGMAMAESMGLVMPSRPRPEKISIEDAANT